MLRRQELTAPFLANFFLPHQLTCKTASFVSTKIGLAGPETGELRLLAFTFQKPVIPLKGWFNLAMLHSLVHHNEEESQLSLATFSELQWEGREGISA